MKLPNLISSSFPFQKKVKLQKRTILALSFLFLIFFLSFFLPFFSPHPFDQISLDAIYQAPSLSHPFGTDDLGRDLLTRCFHGGRTSLLIAFTATSLDLCLGLAWGGLAAMRGGFCESFMMSVLDVLEAIPQILLVILFVLIMGSGLLPIILALALKAWINMARITRAQFRSLLTQEYVQLSFAMGGSRWHVFKFHLLPNTLSHILSTVALSIALAISTEAFLSFVGIGIQEPMTSWGLLITNALHSLPLTPWPLFFPSFLMASTLFSFHILSDSIPAMLEGEDS